jgi:hypothetical protein
MQMRVKEEVRRSRKPAPGNYVRWRIRGAKTKIFLSAEGELAKFIDTNWDGRSKIFREFLENLYPEMKGKLSWGRKVGCSCGCSPGFLFDGHIRDEEREVVDIYLTLEAA